MKSTYQKSLSIGLKKSGFEKKVSVSVPKIFGIKKKSSKKSLGLGLKNIWPRKKSLSIDLDSRLLKRFCLKKISISASKIFGLKKVEVFVSDEFSGLITLCP